MIVVLKALLDELKSAFSPKRLFPEIPTVDFYPVESYCQCGGKLKIKKSDRKRVVTLAVGEFNAREWHMHCAPCAITYRSSELKNLVPTNGNFGFDVIVEIGMALFFHSKGEEQIKGELLKQNITISISEISHLGKRFIVYLALIHKDSHSKLKNLMNKNGGCIIHLDATCEGDSPHLMSAIDGLSEIVLSNIKLPSKNKDQIIPFLKEIKKLYGNPLALVHDMGVGILKSVKEVFPGVLDFICHYHFARDIGKDLFGYEYSMLLKSLKGYRVRAKLRETKKKLKKMIDDDPALISCFNSYLESNQLDLPDIKLLPEVMVYILVIWALESNSELKGFGFPFDRAHLVFYVRLKEVYRIIQNLESGRDLKKKLESLTTTLSEVVNDRDLKRIFTKMQEKIKVFDRKRSVIGSL